MGGNTDSLWGPTLEDYPPQARVPHLVRLYASVEHSDLADAQVYAAGSSRLQTEYSDRRRPGKASPLRFWWNPGTLWSHDAARIFRG